MRYDAIDFATVRAIARGRGGRRSRSERLRDVSRSLAAGRCPDFEVIDEAFAGFTRVDAPRAGVDERTVEDPNAIPAGLSDCLSAQLNALDRQRTQIAQVLRRIDQESQVV
jgi:hypothetical protein